MDVPPELSPPRDGLAAGLELLDVLTVGVGALTLGLEAPLDEPSLLALPPDEGGGAPNDGRV